MSAEVNEWRGQLKTVLSDLKKQTTLTSHEVLVIGCSTSEVIGEKIGTAGTLDVAQMMFDELLAFQQESGVGLAFQCCEHLNRALIVEKETAIAKGLEMVTVVPVRTAGGAMATYAYNHFKHPVVVEFIKADAGIDIGDTFIGMHLKHVAVPIRSTVKQIGQAHVTMAKTRPKLIGGARAVYTDEKENNQC
ncbi:TIGR01440 family protein [Bacillus sp. PS06]|uniref:TIGR01440 family protein n=1 Tax=Bacillus sp. PS06 TaxID=2764176 RepID=UPI001782E6D0|nr:TIGR01440 family protein [Bacillus sp. PS06]MBD8069513.1 TIGR01440 family protein [Bacillus sp. PS06]